MIALYTGIVHEGCTFEGASEPDSTDERAASSSRSEASGLAEERRDVARGNCPSQQSVPRRKRTGEGEVRDI